MASALCKDLVYVSDTVCKNTVCWAEVGQHLACARMLSGPCPVQLQARATPLEVKFAGGFLHL